tara:strand:+ start:2485 stop:2898 length:414 start_codon:yes stop_codon:yes gene_type:complete
MSNREEITGIDGADLSELVRWLDVYLPVADFWGKVIRPTPNGQEAKEAVTAVSNAVTTLTKGECVRLGRLLVDVGLSQPMGSPVMDWPAIHVDCPDCGDMHTLADNGWSAVLCTGCGEEIPYPKTQPDLPTPNTGDK